MAKAGKLVKIGPFPVHAIDEMVDLAKTLSKPAIKAEKKPPIIEIPADKPKAITKPKNDVEKKADKQDNLVSRPLKTNPKDIREISKSWPPHKKARFNTADQYYEDTGYTNYDSHLRGIGFDQPVEIVDLKKGDKLHQYSYIDEDTGIPKVGSYFYSDPNIDHTKLGFSIEGRSMIETNLNDSGKFLKNQAANIEDWNPGSDKIFEGGATQLFNPNVNLGDTIIMD